MQFEFSTPIHHDKILGWVFLPCPPWLQTRSGNGFIRVSIIVFWKRQNILRLECPFNPKKCQGWCQDRVSTEQVSIVLNHLNTSSFLLFSSAAALTATSRLPLKYQQCFIKIWVIYQATKLTKNEMLIIPTASGSTGVWISSSEAGGFIICSTVRVRQVNVHSQYELQAFWIDQSKYRK